MSVKIKGWEILEVIKQMSENGLWDKTMAQILVALIKNGNVHADDVWPAERLIEAYESVMGEYHPTGCDCDKCVVE